VKKLLITDDDDAFRERLAASFWKRGYDTRTAADAVSAQQLLADFTPDYAVLDLRMPGVNGLELLAFLRRSHPACVVVLLTGFGSIATALQALRLGAHDYLSKPADADQIEAALLGRGGARDADDGAQVPSLERVEWEHLQRVLAECGHNISQAARLLGLDRRSLQRKLRKHPPPR
jgi:two-component system response regulator RegA